LTVIKIGGEEFSCAEVMAEGFLGRPLSGREAKYERLKLYVVGSLSIPPPKPRVAVVGTRMPSDRGIELAEAVVGELVREGVTVVSGLARGIDTVAHKTAIEKGGKTVAVLGTPVDVFYPPENRELQLRLMRDHMVVSQFPLGWPVTRRNFPMRNKTMALLSDATVIVEAGERSGVIHQARECVRLGRPLFVNRSLRRLAWVREVVGRGAVLFEDVGILRGWMAYILPRAAPWKA
jgi:DNA processing protein